MESIIYKTEVYILVGACMEVYNTLGYGFLEIVYKDAMEFEFIEKQLEYCREIELPISYKGIKLNRSFFADFILFGNIIVEVKANADGISDATIAQTLNYLKASGHRIGVVINFGKRKLEYKRVIF
jgi:GxxExxY protein